jgi:transglutaminase-like putative cysteine protease
VSVPLPDGRLIDIDPTNDQFADSRYIVSAWGRDLGDVSPLKGVLFARSTTSTREVAVDVTRL